MSTSSLDARDWRRLPHAPMRALSAGFADPTKLLLFVIYPHDYKDKTVNTIDEERAYLQVGSVAEYVDLMNDRKLEGGINTWKKADAALGELAAGLD
jgi:hypothetical protein